MTPPFSSSRRRLARQASRAFTLLEILVVLAILGLLVSLAVSNLDKIFGGAQDQAAEMFVKQSVKVPLTSYRMNMGDYPSTAEGLRALITPPANKADRWKGPYIEGELPADPWSEPYQYRYPGTKNKTGPDIWSKGPDKQDGTGDDIGNWPKDTAAK